MNKFILTSLLALFVMGTSCAMEKVSKPNEELLRRIGIDYSMDCPNPPFAVAVIDNGDMYQHQWTLNVSPYSPIPENGEMQQNSHAFMVASVIGQIFPSLRVKYFAQSFTKNIEDYGDHYTTLLKAIEDPEVKIINCSYSMIMPVDSEENFIKTVERAQELNKLIVVSAANCEGWLGLISNNRLLTKLANNQHANQAFCVIGGSYRKENREQIDVGFLKAGALRACYLILPGVDIPVATPKGFQGQVRVDGTSFSAPLAVGSISYVMMKYAGFTPYEAWRQLCLTADQPIELAHASVADQGWGYLNLKQALIGAVQNPLIETTFTRLYDRHMRRPYVSIAEVDQYPEYPQEVIDGLRHEDLNNGHVKQLLRAGLFERGMHFLVQDDFDRVLSLFSESKELGLTHTDPMSSIDVMLAHIDKKAESPIVPSLKWYKAMLTMAKADRNKFSFKKGYWGPQALRTCLENGYFHPVKDADLIYENLTDLIEDLNSNEGILYPLDGDPREKMLAVSSLMEAYPQLMGWKIWGVTHAYFKKLINRHIAASEDSASIEENHRKAVEYVNNMNGPIRGYYLTACHYHFGKHCYELYQIKPLEFGMSMVDRSLAFYEEALSANDSNIFSAAIWGRIKRAQLTKTTQSFSEWWRRK